MLLKYRDFVLDNDYDIGMIIRLEPDEYELLLKQNYLEFQINDYNLFNEKEIFIYRDIFDYPYDFIDNPYKIISLLENSCFGKYLPYPNSKIVLLDNKNVLKWIDEINLNEVEIVRIEESKLEIDKRVIEFLNDKTDYLGVISMGCGFESEGVTCGDIECYCDFVYVKNKICYCYLGGCDLNFINFFPFKF